MTPGTRDSSGDAGRGPRRCPALFVSAPASGQGKTTVTAALARFHRDRGRQVRVFKTGPDFLDPMILTQASGNPVYQLDLWMGGEAHCQALLHEAAGKADLILVEGVMGLFDGEPSSADLAALFGIPVLAVIDASAMAQTFGALAHGLAHWRRGLAFAGTFANRVAGARHYRMLSENLPPDLACLGWLARDTALTLPERHLGLVSAQEITGLEQTLDQLASALADVRLEIPPIVFTPPISPPPPPSLDGLRIAVARDDAFAFIYPANIDLLEAMGARIIYFSPLAGDRLPAADSLWLPGGYPELHLDSLAMNTALIEDIRHHHRAGRPMLAECGGLLYLLDSLTRKGRPSRTMAGLLAGHGVVGPGLAALGLQAAHWAGGELRGHSFHYARHQNAPRPALYARHHPRGERGEAVHREGRLVASFVHWYFPSNPGAVAEIFKP